MRASFGHMEKFAGPVAFVLVIFAAGTMILYADDGASDVLLGAGRWREISAPPDAPVGQRCWIYREGIGDHQVGGMYCPPPEPCE